MRVRSSSRRSLATSAAWSDGDVTGLAGIDRGNAPGCGREANPFKLARHCLSIDGWIPSSAAICICGRPLLSSSATASRLNSGVNSRLAFAIQHHPYPHGAYQRCPRNQGRITRAAVCLDGRHERVSARLLRATGADVHAVLVLDDAGWHVTAALQVPDNVTLVKLPPYAPELNPVERMWLYLREGFLSHRLHADQEAVMDAACKAWNRLTPDRLRSLCNYPWIRQVTS